MGRTTLTALSLFAMFAFACSKPAESDSKGKDIGSASESDPTEEDGESDQTSTPTDQTDPGTSDDPDPGTCPQTANCPGTALGTVRGDTGADVLEASGVGMKYMRVEVDEGSKQSVGLKIQVDLTVDGGKSLGTRSLTLLELSSATTMTCDSASTAAVGDLTVSKTWDDQSGNEDAKSFVILVQPTGPDACTPWKLKVHR